MRIRVTVHRARLGRDAYRVIRPARPIRGVALTQGGDWHRLMCTDGGEALRVAALWHLAARSRRSLVHLPLRADPGARAVAAEWWEGPPLDLLLLHHSLRMPPGHWRQVRARLDQGRPHTADTGTDMRAEFEAQTGRLPPGGSDRLDLAVHAATAVFTGSPSALFAGAYPFMRLALRGPGAVRSGRGGDHPGAPYYTTTLHPFDGLLRRTDRPGVLLVYRDPWLERRRAAGAERETEGTGAAETGSG
ncbi:hypothetical protein [Allonocardiopsis opalescens]|uniref:Uncharacterized protein n=1 Tax=Allonocardiopsis opalescens TaxID=1144618 RepID=A0A2T0Q9B0_9ACTN|nr:hypothetical protein [Allonocardiopsis opalescens]PRY00476.1 hypothetical protein CLV72_102107 [Allonocardiopsis opalescens]